MLAGLGGGSLDTTNTPAVDPKHEKELARLRRKMSRTRLIGIGIMLASPGLGAYAIRRIWGVDALIATSGFGVMLLGVFAFMLYVQAQSLRGLKESMGQPPFVAFHSPNSGYVFISPAGLFVEKALNFLRYVVSARFDYATRKLVIGILHTSRNGSYTVDMSIDVPENVSAEPLELYCSLFNESEEEDEEPEAAPRAGSA